MRFDTACCIRAVHLLGAAVVTSVTLSTHAGPEGGQVVSGAADIASAAGITTIEQHTDRAILVWDAFNIGRNEQVNFIQPSSDAAALNRVTGAGASIIEGLLSANGNVFIVNPAGILFSDTARVDVGGLVATTANIGDDAFMAGNFEFDVPSPAASSVVNRGLISARDSGIVALVAPGVANSGVIQARLGEITLASGRTFTLDLYGDGLIRVPVADQLLDTIVTADGQPLRALVDQSGELRADGGRVYLLASAASAAFDAAIDASGSIRSRAAESTPGTIVLAAGHGVVSVSGELDASGVASGEKGGDVTVTGDEVVVAATANIDARGDAGGGSVLIGGDYQGRGELDTATSTDVQAGAIVDASATGDGDGGKIIVWADGDTSFAGLVRADGGARGGDGGFIEVSGKQLLRFVGNAFASAPAGVPGAILLDPENLLITPFGRPYTEDGTSAAVLGESISAMLRQGMKVTLTADETITLRDVIDGRSLTGDSAAPGAELILNAGNGIVIDDGFGAVTNNGEISLSAGAGGITMGVDAYLIVADGGLPETEATPGIAGISLTGAGEMTLARVVSLGRVWVSSGSAVTFNESLFGADGGPGVGELDVDAGGHVALNGVGAANSIDVRTTAGDIIVPAPDAGSNTTLIAGNSVTLDAAGDIDVAAQTDGNASIVAGAAPGATAATLQIIADDAITLSGGVLNERGAVTMGDLVRTASIDAEVIQAIGAGDEPTGGSDIALRAAGSITVQEIVTGRSGDVVIHSSGAVTVEKAIAGLAGAGSQGQGVASVDIDAAGRVELAGARTAGQTAVTTTGPIQIVSADGVSGALVSEGNVELTTTGQLTLSANTGIDSEANVTIIADAGTALASDVAAAGSLAIGSQARPTSGVSADGRSLVAEGGDLSVRTSGTLGVDRLDAANGNVLVNADTIVLNGDADTVAIFANGNSVNLTATGSITSLGSVVADNANIAMSAGGAMTLSAPIQTQNGAITLTAGNTVNAADLLTRGAIAVTSTEGSVTLKRPLGGFVNGANLDSPASITVSADGDVTLSGATTESGDITVTAGGAFTSANPNGASSGGAIIAAGDLTIDASSATLNAGTGLQAGLAGGGIQDGAGNDVTIDAAGAVAVNASVVAFNGSIAIGQNTPVESLSMGAGTALQALDGGISVAAYGDIGVHELLTGGAVEIVLLNDGVPGDIDDLDPRVMLHEPLFGRATANVEAPAGIGSLDVEVQNAAGAIEMWGAVATTPQPTAIRLVAPRISVMGPLEAKAGGIEVGMPGAKISLNHNVKADGGDITFTGDTTLFAGRLSSGTSGFAGIFFYLPEEHDANALSLFGTGGLLARDPSRDAQARRLSADDVTDPEVLASVTQYLPEDGSSLFEIDEDVADASKSCQNGANFFCALELFAGIDDADGFFVDELIGPDNDNDDEPDFVLPDLVFNDDRQDIAYRTVIHSVVDANGNMLVLGIDDARTGRSFALSSLCDDNECAGLEVGDDLSFLFDPIASAEIVESINRQIVFERMFGTATLAITAPDGDIEFKGALDRYDTLGDADSLAQIYGDSLRYSYSNGTFSVDGTPMQQVGAVPLVLFPTYVNHHAHIASGSSVSFAGVVGDSAAFGDPLLSGDGYSMQRAAWCDPGTACLPSLGTFSLDVDAPTVSFGAASTVFVNNWVAPNAVLPAGSIVDNLMPDDEEGRYPFFIRFGGTTFDAERRYTGADQPALGRGGFTARTALRGIGSEGSTSTPVIFVSATGASRSLVSAAGEGSATSGASVGSPSSNVEATNQERNGEDSDVEPADATEESLQRSCPDGAAGYADLGLSQAHKSDNGNVFERCEGDFGG